jgi:hypothetical protein
MFFKIGKLNVVVSFDNSWFESVLSYRYKRYTEILRIFMKIFVTAVSQAPLIRHQERLGHDSCAVLYLTALVLSATALVLNHSCLRDS